MTVKLSITIKSPRVAVPWAWTAVSSDRPARPKGQWSRGCSSGPVSHAPRRSPALWRVPRTRPAASPAWTSSSKKPLFSVSDQIVPLLPVTPSGVTSTVVRATSTRSWARFSADSCGPVSARLSGTSVAMRPLRPGELPVAGTCAWAPGGAPTRSRGAEPALGRPAARPGRAGAVTQGGARRVGRAWPRIPTLDARSAEPGGVRAVPRAAPQPT